MRPGSILRARGALAAAAVAGAAVLAGARLPRAEAPSSAYLALLPEGEAKRKFILDCTGCHLFDGNIAFPASEPRTREGGRRRSGG